MSKMKDSGIEWIGEIPEHWGIERLKYHAVLNPATVLPEYDETDDVSFVPMDHLKSGYHNTSSAPYKKVKTGYVTFAEGDILMAKVTPCLENGNLAISGGLRDKVGFGSTEINVLRCNAMNAQYLFYTLQCPSLIEKAKSNMFGVAGLKRLTPDFLPNAYFPLPSEEEQSAIVSFLNRKCAEIDALIAAKEKTNALLKERRQSIIYEAVTKGLNPNAPMKPSGVEWIGEIPKEWKTIKVKHTGHYQSGDSITAAEITQEGEYPVYGGNGLRGYTTKATHHGEYLLIGRQGALCGNVHFVKGDFWASEHAVVGDISEKFDAKYVYYVLDVFGLNRLSLTAAQPGISVEQIVNVVIPCPSSLRLQKQISDYLDTQCDNLDMLVSANKKEIGLLKEYRQSVIFEAVTGKINI